MIANGLLGNNRFNTLLLVMAYLLEKIVQICMIYDVKLSFIPHPPQPSEYLEIKRADIKYCHPGTLCSLL